MAKSEPQIGWWIADLANLISISCAVIARICVGFAQHHWSDLTPASSVFIVELGQGFAWLAFAWVVVGGVFAARYRAGRGTANEGIAYVGLLVVALAGIVVVLMNMPA